MDAVVVFSIVLIVLYGILVSITITDVVKTLYLKQNHENGKRMHLIRRRLIEVFQDLEEEIRLKATDRHKSKRVQERQNQREAVRKKEEEEEEEREEEEEAKRLDAVQNREGEEINLDSLGNDGEVVVPQYIFMNAHGMNQIDLDTASSTIISIPKEAHDRQRYDIEQNLRTLGEALTRVESLYDNATELSDTTHSIEQVSDVFKSIVDALIENTNQSSRAIERVEGITSGFKGKNANGFESRGKGIYLAIKNSFTSPPVFEGEEGNFDHLNETIEVMKIFAGEMDGIIDLKMLSPLKEELESSNEIIRIIDRLGNELVKEWNSFYDSVINIAPNLTEAIRNVEESRTKTYRSFLELLLNFERFFVPDITMVTRKYELEGLNEAISSYTYIPFKPADEFEVKDEDIHISIHELQEEKDKIVETLERLNELKKQSKDATSDIERFMRVHFTYIHYLNTPSFGLLRRLGMRHFIRPMNTPSNVNKQVIEVVDLLEKQKESMNRLSVISQGLGQMIHILRKIYKDMRILIAKIYKKAIDERKVAGHYEFKSEEAAIKWITQQEKEGMVKNQKRNQDFCVNVEGEEFCVYSEMEDWSVEVEVEAEIEIEIEAEAEVEGNEIIVEEEEVVEEEEEVKEEIDINIDEGLELGIENYKDYNDTSTDNRDVTNGDQMDDIYGELMESKQMGELGGGEGEGETGDLLKILLKDIFGSFPKDGSNHQKLAYLNEKGLKLSAKITHDYNLIYEDGKSLKENIDVIGSKVLLLKNSWTFENNVYLRRLASKAEGLAKRIDIYDSQILSSFDISASILLDLSMQTFDNLSDVRKAYKDNTRFVEYIELLGEDALD